MLKTQKSNISHSNWWFHFTNPTLILWNLNTSQTKEQKRHSDWCKIHTLIWRSDWCQIHIPLYMLTYSFFFVFVFFSITQKWVRKCVFKQIAKKLLVHPWHLQEHIYVALFDENFKPFDENFKPFEFMYKMYKSI